jgi:hypothetical protein
MVMYQLLSFWVDKMSQVTIPMDNVADFFEKVTLDGGIYGFRFYWNARGAFWSMDISDANANLIVSGVKLIINFPMLLQYHNSALPPGHFVIMDLNPKTQYQEPGRFDFVSGRNLQLCYFSNV